MVIKIKKNINYVFLIFVLLMDNCLYLVNTDLIHITGSFAYSDIWLIAFILYFFWQYIKNIKRPMNGKYKQKFLVCALCILVVISALQQTRLTGQSLNMGIRPQRNYLIILLAYFPIRKLMDLKKISIEHLFLGLMKLGTIAACFYITQKLLYPNIQFIYAGMAYRNGTLRMYIETSVIQFAGMMSIYYFCNSYKFKYLIYYLLNFIDIFWVGQGRLEIISFFVATIIGIFFTKKLNKKRILVIIFGILLVVIFLNSSFSDSLWKAILSADTASTEAGNTMKIRYLGRKRYFEQITASISTLLFGCGYPNALYAPAANKAGYNININLNDNGIWGFTYIYGIIGLVLMLILFIKMLYQAFCVYRETNNNFYIMYLSILGILAYNVIMWYWYAGGTFILIIFMCALEEQVANINKKKSVIKGG